MIRRPLPFAVKRSFASARRRGRRWRRQPLTRVLVFRAEPRRTGWRRWLAAAAGVFVSTLAPLPVHAQSDSLVVTWTASGDDERFGAATTYDMRVSVAPIDATNFDAATPVGDLPSPALNGTRQRVTVRGLTRGTVYYFAIKSVDDAGNWSEISNVLRWDWLLDTAPPATPGGLTASRQDGHVRVAWTPSAEPDFAGYRVYRALGPDADFVPLTSRLLEAAEYVDTTIPAGTASVRYQISAVDVSGNESGRSMAVTLALVVPGTEVTAPTLEPAYPNPAHGEAPSTIPVVMPAGATSAVVDIVTNGGVRVRRIDVPPTEGRREVVWDGRNDAGRLVAPGPYRAWLIAGSTRTSIRLLRVP